MSRKDLRVPEHPCSPGCPGWAIITGGLGTEIQRCDDCWSNMPDFEKPSDDDYAEDPFCQAVMALVLDEDPAEHPEVGKEDWMEAAEYVLEPREKKNAEEEWEEWERRQESRLEEQVL